MPEQDSQDALTDEERRLLTPYVTNTDGPVFALVNLPEVIKGALFSRYSRSALGLRRLLLKEFLTAPESGFDALAGAAGAAAGAADARLAIGRAQSFYDRILDGYGDDSIGELGGAHLALEEISMLAAKAVQDARIGGSPLEKSTRYVNFGDQVDGDYRFYKEPTLMASPHREAYLGLCRSLFETYRELLEPVKGYFLHRAPRPEKVGERVWAKSAPQRAYDALRGLLPASTLTNMGVFGNGRFFEALLVKLQVSGVSEFGSLAKMMSTELDKVIPSFVRRASATHPHFSGFRTHLLLQKELLEELSRNANRDLKSSQGDSRDVQLAQYDPEAETKLFAALAFPGSTLPIDDLFRWSSALSDEVKRELIVGLASLRTNRRHKPPRALEIPSYTFDLVGDFGMYRDMQRHRTLTQERQLLSTLNGYETPEAIEEAGVVSQYRDQMDRAAEVCVRIAKDFPSEAQYCVPMAFRVRWYMHINLRALIWLVELRSAPQGHIAYRRMAQEMYRAVVKVHKAFDPLFAFVDTEGEKKGAARYRGRQSSEERLYEGLQLDLPIW